MEIWDLYDEHGNKTGETWERSRAKEIPEGRFHIVCDILIRHQDGEFLLTFRDPHKDVYPGCWEASAGGSALAGETPEECARREMANHSYCDTNATPVPVLYPATGCITRRGLQGVASSGQGVALTFQ